MLKPKIRASRVACVLTVLGGLAAAASAGVVTWDGGAGTSDWNDADNWNPTGVPGPTDDVIIDVASNPTIEHTSGNHEIASLTCDETFAMSGGTLTAGDMSFNEELMWTAGTLSGTGTVFANGPLSVSGGGNKILGCDLEIDAGASWIDDGQFFLTNATLTNNFGSLLDVQNDRAIVNNGGTNAFINNGSLHKTMGVGETSIAVPCTNNGTMDVQSGELRFSQGREVLV